MNDETPAKEENEDGPVGGERLRKARRENDISVRDVAKELHLDEYKVRALEKNEFDVLGAPVFAKGHLRKYAELVGVDTDDVMTDYYQMNRAAGAPPVVGPKRKMPSDTNPMPWIIGAVAVLVIALAGLWWFLLRSPEPVVSVEPEGLAPFVAESAPETTAAAEPDPEPVQQETAVASDEPVATEVVDDATDDAADDVVAVAAATPTYQPTPGVPQVGVDLVFSGDCWTEVSDASGRRLFYELGYEGRVVTVAGDAPLRIILGDADNVSLSVDGEAWPIPASARRGRLARLTISPQ